MNPDITSLSGSKRPYEGELFPVNKKPKIEEIGATETRASNGLNGLGSSFPWPSDILVNMMQFLNFKDFLTCRQLSNRIRNEVDLSFLWRKFSKKERLDFDWPDFEKEYYPERARYQIGKSLFIYVKAKENLLEDGIPSTQEIQELYRRFEYWMSRYPLLGGYIWKDLTSLAPSLFTTFKTEFEQAGEALSSHSSKVAGSLLLKGLFHLIRYPGAHQQQQVPPSQVLHESLSYLKGAIREGATCASDLAIRSLCLFRDQIHNFESLSYSFCHVLARASADKGPDYSGLERFVKEYPEILPSLYESGVWDPPILAEFARKAANLPYTREAELYDQAIEGYLKSDHPIPVSLFINAARTNSTLNNNQQASEYFSRAFSLIEERGDDVDSEVYSDAGEVEEELENWQKTSEYYHRAFFLTLKNGDEVDPGLCRKIAFVEAKLGNLQTASAFYDQAFYRLKEENKKEKSVPLGPFSVTISGGFSADVYEDAAVVEFKLKNWQTALEYYNEAFSEGHVVSYEDYEKLAFIESKLKNWQKAAKYCHKAHELCLKGDKSLSHECIEMAQKFEELANKECDLREWTKAISWYKTAIVAYSLGQLAPPDSLLRSLKCAEWEINYAEWQKRYAATYSQNYYKDWDKEWG